MELGDLHLLSSHGEYSGILNKWNWGTHTPSLKVGREATPMGVARTAGLGASPASTFLGLRRVEDFRAGLEPFMCFCFKRGEQTTS